MFVEFVFARVLITTMLLAASRVDRNFILEVFHLLLLIVSTLQRLSL